MLSQIAEGKRTEYRVDHGVNENIRVGVTFETLFVRNVDSA